MTETSIQEHRPSKTFGKHLPGSRREEARAVSLLLLQKQGFEQIAALFLKTTENEKTHAELWFKELGEFGGTESNLHTAAEGENYEWTDMYIEFAAAGDEGFPELINKL